MARRGSSISVSCSAPTKRASTVGPLPPPAAPRREIAPAASGLHGRQSPPTTAPGPTVPRTSNTGGCPRSTDPRKTAPKSWGRPQSRFAGPQAAIDTHRGLSARHRREAAARAHATPPNQPLHPWERRSRCADFEALDAPAAACSHESSPPATVTALVRDRFRRATHPRRARPRPSDSTIHSSAPVPNEESPP